MDHHSASLPSAGAENGTTKLASIAKFGDRGRVMDRDEDNEDSGVPLGNIGNIGTRDRE